MEKRTYTASDQTKHALASALKELMAQKRIDKITIHDITERCGIRQFGHEVGAISAGVTEADIELTTHFYVVALAGMLESWLLGEIDRTPEELIRSADRTLMNQVQGARLRYSKNIP